MVPPQRNCCGFFFDPFWQKPFDFFTQILPVITEDFLQFEQILKELIFNYMHFMHLFRGKVGIYKILRAYSIFFGNKTCITGFLLFQSA